MKPFKIWSSSLFLLFCAFVGVNYAWSHAAIASAVSPQCSSGLNTQAQEAVASLFGDAQSAPYLSCHTGPTLGLSISHGTAFFAPGLTSIIVLGPQGHNSDVASHEYAHTELAYRTSALLRTYRVPTWFDEGLAMQLDHRSTYTLNALQGYLNHASIKPPRLDQLTKTSDFYKPGMQGRAHYAFARCVVGSWLEDNSKAELARLINNIGWFQDFPSGDFRIYEKKCLS